MSTHKYMYLKMCDWESLWEFFCDWWCKL